MQQEAENGRLQEQLSSLGEKCEELEKRKQQLEQEVAKLKHLLETNVVDCRQTEQYKREVRDLSEQLEKESTRRTQLEAQHSCLQEQVSTMCKSYEELEKRKQQLKEEVAKLKHRMATDMVDCSQIEQRKKEAEEELARALRRQLEEDILFRRTQAVPQDILDQVTGSLNAMRDELGNVQRQMGKMETSYQESCSKEQRLRVELGTYKTQFLREFNFRKSMENQLARANERLAEANAQLLQEQSTEVGHLGKDLTLNRSLSLGGSFQSPTWNALPSRNRVEASVVQQEPEEKITEELEQGTDELETGSMGSSSTRSSDRTSYGIPEIELDSI